MSTNSNKHFHIERTHNNLPENVRIRFLNQRLKVQERFLLVMARSRDAMEDRNVKLHPSTASENDCVESKAFNDIIFDCV
jgi:hypothetical protein